MEDLQSWWEVPSVAHFCSLFRQAFDLPDFDIEELEEGLLANGQEDNALVEQVTLRLLQGYHQRPDIINVANHEKYLFDLIRKKWAAEGRSIDVLNSSKFATLLLRTKVEILFSLCDYRLDANDVLDVLKNLESESLRVEPLGKDDNGATYWYFYGTRLYKEETTKRHNKRYRGIKGGGKKDPRKKKRNKDRKRTSDRRGKDDPHDCTGVEWCVVCSTESDWIRLAEKFRTSKSRTERELHRCLTEDFIPEIGRIIQDKERNTRKRLLESVPRRMSHRIERLRQQEEENEAATIADEQQRHRQELEQRNRDNLATKNERASRATKRLSRDLNPTGDYNSSDSSTFVTTMSSSSSTTSDDDNIKKDFSNVDLSFPNKTLKLQSSAMSAENSEQTSGSTHWWGEPHLVLGPQRLATHLSDPIIGRSKTILQIYPNQVVAVTPTSYRTARVGSFYSGKLALQKPP